MLTKKEMLEAFLEEGLSIIECERIFDSKEDFINAIEDIIEKAMSERKPKFKVREK